MPACTWPLASVPLYILQPRHPSHGPEAETGPDDLVSFQLVLGSGVLVNIYQSALGERQPWFVMFANFCGINTSAIGYFELSTWCHRWSCTNGSPQLVRADHTSAQPANIQGGPACTAQLAASLLISLSLPLLSSVLPLRSNITSPHWRAIILQQSWLLLEADLGCYSSPSLSFRSISFKQIDHSSPENFLVDLNLLQLVPLQTGWYSNLIWR